MRLPKRLSGLVMFAAWCKVEDQEPAAVARLLVLASRAKRAGERSCSERDYPRRLYEDRMTEFEAAAQQLGYTVDWPGLWPVLHRGGQNVYLPDV